jgi:hypothetical protein
MTPDAIRLLEQFEKWREYSDPKSSFTYYVGHIIADRGHINLAPTVAQVARHVWNFYEAGEITLVQKRIRDDLYHYIAVRLHTSKRRPKLSFTPERLQVVASA